MKSDSDRIGKIGNSKVIIGRYTYGFENLSVRQWNEGATLKIGSFCSLASSITILLGGNHRMDWITTFPFGQIYQEELGGTDIDGQALTNGDVVIGDDVWIGHGVTIMSGITIGSGAVLAANSHVVKDVQPYEIVGGNPARFIGKRFADEIIEKLLKLKWWELPTVIIREIIHDLSSPPSLELLDSLIEQYRFEIS